MLDGVSTASASSPVVSVLVSRGRPADLVGRHREQGLARRLVDDLTQGQGATLVIEGEAGIGKTRLVEYLIDLATTSSVSVRRGESHPFERTRPFAAIADALDLRHRSPDRRRAAAGRMISHPDRSLAGERAGQDFRHSVVEEIVDLVEVECTRGPVLLVIEDLHWADASTLMALSALAHRLVHVPFLLVASVRPSPRSPELGQFLEDAQRAGADFVRLEPLTPDETLWLASVELSGPPGPRLRAMVTKAGGNPLWVVEIIRSVSDEGRVPTESGAVDVTTPELPESLRELVLRQLSYLPEGTLELLQTAAVLGDAVSVGDLAAVARRPAAEVIEGLRETFRARLLGEQGDAVVFRHQLVHDAIYQEMPLPVRRAMHRDAAGLLARAGADLLRVADHLMLGAARGDLEAGRWLREAARDAAAGAPSVAVELLRRAESLLPGGHPDADLVAAELVDALLRGGDVAEAASRAQAVLDRRHRAEADVLLRLSLVSALSLQNRAGELMRRAESALKDTDHLSLAEQALVLAQESYGRTFSGDVMGGEEAARRGLWVAESSGDKAMTVWALTTLSVALKSQGRYGEALSLTRRAVGLAFEPPDLEARQRHPLFFLGLTLSDADLAADARVAFDRAVDECEALGSSWLLPDTILMSAEARLLAGEWDDASAELEAGLDMALRRGQRILVAQSRAHQAIVAEARGDRPAAQLALTATDVDVESEAPRYGAELVAFAHALIAEADGDRATAYRLLLGAWEGDVERQNRYYHRYLAPALVRLALSQAEPEIAARVAGLAVEGAVLTPEVPSVQSAARRCRGLVEKNPDLMVEAVNAARRSGRALDHALSCEDAARVLSEAGRAGEAEALLREAMARYEELDARAWAARVRLSLRRLGVRPGTAGPRQRPSHGWESLTASERDVSRLVAEGLTNRQVASRLHISPHTVNTHLRHVFAKLGISNRAELAAAVTRHSRLAL